MAGTHLKRTPKFVHSVGAQDVFNGLVLVARSQNITYDAATATSVATSGGAVEIFHVPADTMVLDMKLIKTSVALTDGMQIKAGDSADFDRYICQSLCLTSVATPVSSISTGQGYLYSADSALYARLTKTDSTITPAAGAVYFVLIYRPNVSSAV